MSARLDLKVAPRAARDRISAWMGDVLKVAVTAPPERGKANAAVCALLARALGVPRENVRVVAGATSPRKVVEVDGLELAEARFRLDRAVLRRRRRD